MSSRPGRPQSVFNSGEIDPLMHERTELKYYNAGLKRAENIEITPQGGFRLRDGLRDVGALQADAARILAFNSSQGDNFDLVFSVGKFEVWSVAALDETVTMAAITAPILPEMTAAQRFDTLLLFHQNMVSQRVRVTDGPVWTVDTVPFRNVPNWDYGADINGDPYTNGVSAVWEIEFVGLTDDVSVFTLTISGNETLGVTYDATMANLDNLVEAAIIALPNVEAGVTVASPGANRLRITFAGAGNEGDGWAVTGRVVNKADAAITSAKITVGIPPGEPVFSADRGWPQCGCFYQQRLIVAGFKGLPNAYAWSSNTDVFNYDTRITEADGPALIPMDTEGGEAIEHIIDNRFLLIFTNQGEYWVSERALSRAAAPNHVQASTKGVKRGVPVAANEGAVLYVLPSGNVLDEFRYTDVEGNYVSIDVSLIAAHLIVGIKDVAQRPANTSTDGNHVAVVREDGKALLGTFLRDQDPPITAFTRLTSGAGVFKAVSRNGRNQLSWILERSSGRRLERSEDGLLLDEAVTIAFDPPQATVTGLERFNGREVWAIADNDVFGPFDVTAGEILLGKAAALVTVGSWAPPVVETLPPARDIGPALVNKGKGRIYAATLSLIDTTSVAISTNGRALQDVDLYRWGMPADVPELEAGFTGEIKISGLVGWADEPFLTLSQKRPGRLTVRSITLHAKL